MTVKTKELHNLIEGTRNITERLVPLYRILRASAYNLIGEEAVEKGKPEVKVSNKTINSLNAKQEDLLNMAHDTIEELNYVAEIICREVGEDLDIWNYIEKPKWSKGESKKEREIFDKECAKLNPESILRIMGKPFEETLAKENTPHIIIWGGSNIQIKMEEYNIGVFLVTKIYEDMSEKIKWDTLSDIQDAKNWLDEKVGKTFIDTAKSGRAYRAYRAYCSKEKNEPETPEELFKEKEKQEDSKTCANKEDPKDIVLESLKKIMGKPIGVKYREETGVTTVQWKNGKRGITAVIYISGNTTAVKQYEDFEKPIGWSTLERIQDAKKWLDEEVLQETTEVEEDPPKEKITKSLIFNILGKPDDSDAWSSTKGLCEVFTWNREGIKLVLVLIKNKIVTLSKSSGVHSKILYYKTLLNIIDIKPWLVSWPYEIPTITETAEEKVSVKTIIDIMGVHTKEHIAKGIYAKQYTRTYVWGNGDHTVELQFSDKEVIYFTQFWRKMSASLPYNTTKDIETARRWVGTCLKPETTEDTAPLKEEKVSIKDFVRILGKYDEIESLNTDRGFLRTYIWEQGDIRLRLVIASTEGVYTTTLVKTLGEDKTKTSCKTIKDIEEVRQWWDKYTEKQITINDVKTILGEKCRGEVTPLGNGLITWGPYNARVCITFINNSPASITTKTPDKEFEEHPCTNRADIEAIKDWLKEKQEITIGDVVALISKWVKPFFQN